MKSILIATIALSLSAAVLRADDKPADATPAAAPAASAVVATNAASTNGANTYVVTGNTNKIALTNLNMKAAYIMGLQNGGTMLFSGGEMLDPEIICMGIRDVFYKQQPLLSQDEAEDVMKKFDKAYQEYEVVKARKEAEDNLKDGAAFMEENKKKEGVVTTASGLQYKILKEGSGTPPTENDRAAIHFRSKTIKGIEFSNSYKHSQPVPVLVKGQIKAWREALVMMKPGAKWELYVPSSLAYGSREVGKGVGPNSYLIFELELVEVVKDAPAGEAKK